MEHMVGLEVHRGSNERLDFLVKVAVNLEAHGLKAQAPLEDRLHVLAVILVNVAALIGIDISVARDTHDRRACGLIVTEALGQARKNDILEQDIAPVVMRGWKLDDAR